MSNISFIIHPTVKIALGIEYDGSNYCGWQRQKKTVSIQSCLEHALTKIANTPLTVACAARTDSGVHATGQVVHFVTNVQHNKNAWIMGVNNYLPSNIAVSWVRFVTDDFHARFSAISRCYRYIIYNNRYRPAILKQGITHFYHPLDANRMHDAAQVLLGEHNFTSFRAARCQSCTPWRNIKYINIIRRGKYIIIDIKANSFLYHMVRNIVGSLTKIGTGKKDKNWLAELLILKNRKLAAATAPPEGLYLVSIDYPKYFFLPKQPLGPLFLTDDTLL
ncbi:tRNA pseudouridine synthase A [Candidatus Ecksteinia adelgidicola]|nr:tRNA pseudouridine synthase A [Candidatus Ecksteinia adelgidicola]